MINLSQHSEIEEIIIEVLEGAEGFVHSKAILDAVIRDATSNTYDILKKLRSDGVIESGPTANHWRLKYAEQKPC